MSGDPKRLPCGADLEELSRQVFEGEPARDPDHQAGCEYCRAALRRLRSLAGDLNGVAAVEVKPSRSMVSAVLSRIRARPALITVDVQERGATMVSDAVVAEVARLAAGTVPGVRHASVIASEERPDGVVALRAHLVVALGPSLPEVAEEVKQAVAAAVSELTGATPRSVDVTVEDLA
jgi:uncharacterized alkaline shock family protein YloU